MSENDELLRCPFCGHSAADGIIDEGHEEWGGRTRHFVTCTNCSASVEEETEQEAREAWNERWNGAEV